MMKKFIGFALTAAVLVSGNIFAAEADPVQEIPSAGSGTIGTDGAEELGTNVPGEKNIVEIGSKEELISIGEMMKGDWSEDTDAVKNTRFVLTSDIDFEGEEISPIGFMDEQTPVLFLGEIDGNGYKISNFKINVNAANYLYAGLFLGIGEGAAVRNLTIENAAVSAVIADTDFNTVAIGGFTGVNYGAINSVAIQNSTVIAESTSHKSDTDVKAYAGGIAGTSWGTVNNSSVVLSHVSAKAANSDSEVGGIIGRINQGDVRGCRADSCDLYAEGRSGAFAGGIAGKNIGRISECRANSDVTVITGSGNGMAGGIVGSQGLEGIKSAPLASDYESYVEKSIYNGTNSVIAMDSTALARACYCGGIVGQLYAKTAVRGCSAVLADTSFATNTKFNVNTRGIYYGGIVGYALGGEITECDSHGVLCGDTAFAVGGIAGSIMGYEYYRYKSAECQTAERHLDAAHVSDCASDMDISVTADNNMYVGGLIGYMNGTLGECDNGRPLLERCYSLGDVTVETQEESLVSIIGGAVGYGVDCVVKNCYSIGDVTMQGIVGTAFLGGFIGRIKENNKTSVTPLSVTENCFAKGRTYCPEGSEKRPLTGWFTSELSGNNQEGNPVSPSVKNCYFHANDKLDKQAGAAQLTDAVAFAAGSYEGWDFSDIWYMDKDGVHLMIEKPCVYAYEAESQNGVESRITKLRLANPEQIKAVYIDFTDTMFEDDLSHMRQTINIDNISEFEKRFMDIDVDIEVPVMTEFTINADAEETKTVVVGTPDVTDDGTLKLTVNNIGKRPQPVRLITVEYAADGSLAGIRFSDETEVTGEVTLSAELPGEKNKVMLWNTSGGAMPMMGAVWVDMPVNE